MDTAHHIFNLRPKTAYVVILNEHVVRLAPTWYPSGQAEVTLDLKPGDRVTFVAIEDTVIATDVPPPPPLYPGPIQLYPNPFSDTVLVTTQREGMLYIYDVAGRQLFERDMPANSNHMLKPGLPSGTYMWGFYTVAGEQIDSGKITVIK